MKLSRTLTLPAEFYAARFKGLRSVDELAHLLEVPPKLLLHVCYNVGVDKYYKTFEIPKKTGEARIISAPKGSLRIIQQKLLQILSSQTHGLKSVHSFRSGRSILTNASVHKRPRQVLNIDLLNFYGTINFGRVRGLFMSSIYGHSPNVATVLAQICCLHGSLPQGAPTSPFISNLIGYALDKKLHAIAKRHKLLYSRYADDITISSTKRIFPSSLAAYVDDAVNSGAIALGPELQEAINEGGFVVNEKKSRLQQRSHRQSVTGLTINDFPNVPRGFLKNIRRDIWLWKRFGLEEAASFSRDKGSSEEFLQRLYGRLAYLKMVRGDDDQLFQSHCVAVCKLATKTPKWMRRAKEQYAVNDVFISYASEDRPIAEAIHIECERRSLSVFYDQKSMEWGDSLTQKINIGLGNAKYFLPILSDTYVAKEWPLKELNSAIATQVKGQKRIVPVVLPGFSISKVPLIEDLLYKSWTNNPAEIAEALAAQVKAYVPK